MEDSKCNFISNRLFSPKFWAKSMGNWILILLVGVCNSLEGLVLLQTFLSRPLPSSKQLTFTYLKLFSLSAVTIFEAALMFKMKWSLFWDYGYHCDQTNAHKDSDFMKKMNQKRKVKVLLLIVLGFITQIIIVTKDQNYDFLRLIIVLASIGHFFLLGIIIDTSVCLESLFEMINSSIENFTFTGSSDTQLERLIELRKNYFHTVQATIAAESCFRGVISFYYIRNSLEIIITVFVIVTSYDLFWVRRICADMLVVIFVTSNLTNVHVTSRKVLEDLYELAIKTDCVSIGDEVSNRIYFNFCFISYFFQFIDILFSPANVKN